MPDGAAMEGELPRKPPFPALFAPAALLAGHLAQAEAPGASRPINAIHARIASKPNANKRQPTASKC
jgi:hypothetical protein